MQWKGDPRPPRAGAAPPAAAEGADHWPRGMATRAQRAGAVPPRRWLHRIHDNTVARSIRGINPNRKNGL